MNILHSSNLSLVVRFSVVTMLAINAACASKSGAEHEAAPPPATVVVAEVSQRTVPIYSEFVGQTRAEETVELRARVEGILQKVYFKEGSVVRKGQLLFTIDKRPFQAAVQSAEAFVAKAVSDLAQAQQRTDVLEAKAQLANAQATLTRADQDVGRLAPLAKEKAVTEQDLDAAIATSTRSNALERKCLPVTRA
jgi:membrane fusion protein (multidrug efflux system)